MQKAKSLKVCRTAVSRLHLTDGSVLHNQVSESIDGDPIRYFPLHEELPGTIWAGGDYYWNCPKP